MDRIEGVFGEYEANENRPGPTLLLSDGPLSYPNTPNLVSSREKPFYIKLVRKIINYCENMALFKISILTARNQT